MDSEENVAKALTLLKAALESNTVDTLQPSIFRIFLDCTKSGRSITVELIQESSNYLLETLSRVNYCSDTQIVIATAYSSSIAYVQQEPKRILDHFSNLLKLEENAYNIYLCHAILQLNNSYWTLSENTSLLLQRIFDVARSTCCAIKSSTYIAFKVLHNLLCKTHLLHPNGKGLSENSFRKILDIVLSNWENPLTGVRQQNSQVFTQLLQFNETIWDKVLPNSVGFDVPRCSIKHQQLFEFILTQLSWSMKSKYFMITGIVQDSTVSKIMDNYGEDLIGGLLVSLSVPRLVTAGTDLYRAVLSEISLPQWQHYFLTEVYRIVSHPTISLDLEYLCDYWMYHTIKKFPLVLDELLNTSSINMNTYCRMSLLRISRKEGLFYISNWESIDKNKLQLALEGYCDKTRIQAFSLVCTSTKSTVLPDKSEFDMVKTFLKQNIYSDNTSFRKTLLKSFTNFTLRIRDSLLHLLKKKNLDTSLTRNCFLFLDWLHSFLLFSLKAGSNYQRKITSLELYNIVLTYFGEPNIRKLSTWSRKGQKDHLSLKMQEDKFLWNYSFDSIESLTTLLNCLFDEDNNIRTNAATIIMSHFKISNEGISVYKELFQTAKALSSGFLFYKAESGAVILQVLVTLISKSSCDELKHFIFNEHKSFSSKLLSFVDEQFNALRKDLFQAVTQNSFLYGTLLTLDFLFSDINGPEHLALSTDEQERLIFIMEESINYFVSILSSQSDYAVDDAPSFGEMGMAVAAVVDHSAATPLAKDSGLVTLHITAAQQLVLNCVWLNLKACSQLLSHLVVFASLSVSQVCRCTNAIVCVLRRCRHKGAIESAGLALYHVTQHVTLSKEAQLLNLPSTLLQEVLEAVVGGPAATVSRRSAGLAILVHRLITGDSRPSKPLLHECVTSLLSVAAEPAAEDAILADLPQSRALHLLHTLTQDASLRQLMAPYTLQVSLLAISNLASPVWTIRNGALQLFGALVPALVGQKPQQDAAAMSHHLALEELHSRAQLLVLTMLAELASSTNLNSIKQHSKLMPLLTLFNSLTVGLHTKLHKDLSSLSEEFKNHFEVLFQSNIFNVRKLSAKAHSLFLTSGEVVPMIEQRLEKISVLLSAKGSNPHLENKLHGYVLNFRYLCERFNEDKNGMKVLLRCEGKVADMLGTLSNSLLSSQHSYFVKALILEEHLFATQIPVESNALPNTSLGFPHFLNMQLNNSLKSFKDKEVIDKTKLYLFSEFSYDIKLSLLKALKELTKRNGKFDYKESLFVTLRQFLTIQNQNSGTEIVATTLETMLYILEDLLSRNKLFCSKFIYFGLEILNSCQHSSIVHAYLIAVICGTMLEDVRGVNVDILEKLSHAIFIRSYPDFDEDVRVLAAKSMGFLTSALKDVSDTGNPSGTNIWKACVNFLQDEVSQVRFEASRFIALFSFNDSNLTKNSFLSLEMMIKWAFMVKIMTPLEALDCLWELMSIPHKSNDPGTISNPFDHGEKGIYTEENVVLEMCYLSILDLASEFDSSIESVIKQKCNLSRECNISKCALYYISLIEKNVNADVPI